MDLISHSGLDGQNVESREYYDKLAKEYDYSESYTRWPWVEYFHIERRIGGIANALERIAANREIGAVADVGCGDGILLPILSKAAKQVVAMELSPERLKMAEDATKGLSNIRFEVANIMESISGYEEKFDVVACSEVIEHVRDYGRFFEQLSAMVAPNGSLILSTPSRWSIREKTLRLQQILLDIYLNSIRKRNIGKYKFFHVGLITVKELRQMAANHFTSWDLRTAGLYFPVVTELGFTVGGERWRRHYRALDNRVGKSSIAWINWTQILVARK